jgi:hypothetical protein
MKSFQIAATMAIFTYSATAKCFGGGIDGDPGFARSRIDEICRNLSGWYREKEGNNKSFREYCLNWGDDKYVFAVENTKNIGQNVDSGYCAWGIIEEIQCKKGGETRRGDTGIYFR